MIPLPKPIWPLFFSKLAPLVGELPVIKSLIAGKGEHLVNPYFRIWLVRLACLVFAGIVSIGATDEVAAALPDPRILKVDAFFDSYGCPAPNYAAEYVRAADLYHVDYRLLPTISLLESTCGSYQRHNNHWGWNSTKTGFPSVVHGIDFITQQLAEGDAYKNRDLDGKLFAYNPRPAYVRVTRRLMQKIEAY